MVGSDEDILRECLIMRLWTVIWSIRSCVWSGVEKDALLKGIRRHRMNGLLTESDVERFEKDLMVKYARYERAYFDYLDDYGNRSKTEVSRTFHENVQDVPPRPEDDISDQSPILGAFLDLVTIYSGRCVSSSTVRRRTPDTL